MPTTDPMPRFQASFTEIVVGLPRATPLRDRQVPTASASSWRTAANSRDACNGPERREKKSTSLVVFMRDTPRGPEAASAVQEWIVTTPLKAGVSELSVPDTAQTSPQSFPF